MTTTSEGGDGLRVTRPASSLGKGVLEKLRRGLQECPDVAFAHLADVWVPGQQAGPEMTLLVWLKAEAVRSVRAALNLVCGVVAGVLPKERYLDVVVLNSAPDLLAEAERADCLLVERDPSERTRALDALRETDGGVVDEGKPPWWWPF